MKLALMAPLHLYSDFFDIIDVQVLNFKQLKEVTEDSVRERVELWAHLDDILTSEDVLIKEFPVRKYLTELRNVPVLKQWKVPEDRIIILWRGSLKELLVIKSMNLEVAVHYKRRHMMRGILHPKETHFYEFKTLDELYRLQPKTIITSIPIEAALKGVDLKLRERRPVNLPSLTKNSRLSNIQTLLAVSNMISIKEVTR